MAAKKRTYVESEGLMPILLFSTDRFRHRVVLWQSYAVSHVLCCHMALRLDNEPNL